MTIFRMTLRRVSSISYRSVAAEPPPPRCARCAAAAAGLNRRDATAAVRRNLLDALEVHLCTPVVEQRAKFRVLRVAQIALRLYDEEVRREADVESALLGVETLLGEIARRLCRLQTLAVGSTSSAALVTSVAICSSS